MVRHYGKILLLASTVYITTSCAKVSNDTE